jgi:signal peptidase II
LEVFLKAFFRKYRWLFLISSIIVILDQVTKVLVRSNLALGEYWVPWEWLAPYARIIHWSNTGVAFGMFQGNNLFFACLAALVAIAIVYYYPSIPEEDRVLRFALAMQLGGAVGNLIDRVVVKEVTDFVSVGDFAVFNVADSCITLGVGVLLLGVYFEDRRERRMKKLAEIMPRVDNENEAASTWPEIISTPNEEVEKDKTWLNQ